MMMKFGRFQECEIDPGCDDERVGYQMAKDWHDWVTTDGPTRIDEPATIDEWNAAVRGVLRMTDTDAWDEEKQTK
jgi:hypothetical protein